MHTLRPILTAALTGLLLGGCHADRGAFLPHEPAKYSIESTEKFALIDEPAQLSVTCTGLQERVNTAGLLEVVANVKNRESRPLVVEVRCVFKDINGFSTGDETPWDALSLEPGATAPVHYTSSNRLAQKFTILVRAGR